MDLEEVMGFANKAKGKGKWTWSNSEGRQVWVPETHGTADPFHGETPGRERSSRQAPLEGLDRYGSGATRDMENVDSELTSRSLAQKRMDELHDYLIYLHSSKDDLIQKNGRRAFDLHVQDIEREARGLERQLMRNTRPMDEEMDKLTPTGRHDNQDLRDLFGQDPVGDAGENPLKGYRRPSKLQRAGKAFKQGVEDTWSPFPAEYPELGNLFSRNTAINAARSLADKTQGPGPQARGPLRRDDQGDQEMWDHINQAMMLGSAVTDPVGTAAGYAANKVMDNAPPPRYEDGHIAFIPPQELRARVRARMNQSQQPGGF